MEKSEVKSLLEIGQGSIYLAKFDVYGAFVDQCKGIVSMFGLPQSGSDF